ncbi:hypothetical protein [Paenibacillus sp. USHLN196]|uniref:hypothetical protein n=1 Tax=Paenibacillus sp. USHLN196 TaxID=3081291 RepID=UPI003FA7526B
MIQQEKMNVVKRTVKKRTSIAALTLALTMLAPLSAMAAPAAMNNNSNLTYETTKKAVIEKAKLLTEMYGTTSLQYALIDGGESVVSGHTGKNDINDKVPLTSNTIYLSFSKDLPVIFFLQANDTETEGWIPLHEEQVKDSVHGKVMTFVGKHYLHHTRSKEMVQEYRKFMSELK